MSVNQGRVVYLGYRGSYSNSYKIRVDYTDSSAMAQTQTSSAFTQNPGYIFAISDFSAATSVSVLDGMSGAVVAKYSGFSASCGDCWPTQQMVDNFSNPVNYWIAWDPDTNVVIVMDDNVLIGPNPNPEG